LRGWLAEAASRLLLAFRIDALDVVLDHVDVLGGLGALKALEAVIAYIDRVLLEVPGGDRDVGPVPLLLLVASGPAVGTFLAGVDLAEAELGGMLGQPVVYALAVLGVEIGVGEGVEVEVRAPVMARGAGHGGVFEDLQRALLRVGNGVGQLAL